MIVYSRQLLDYIERTRLPWVQIDKDTGKIILILDNHLMSLYRACPQHFINYAVEGLKKKGEHSEGVERIWFLEFGILLHRMIELYYKSFREPDFDMVKWATTRAVAEWNEMKMDVHADHKEYKLIGGVHGFVGLLVQFGSIFTPENEKLRIIGSEICFGHNREIPIFIGSDFEVYLAGRIDLIVDDGVFISPMDHKSHGAFYGDMTLQYMNQEGPTGYIYALSSILPKIIPADQILARDCSRILMNLISKKPTATPIERFKRFPIRKTAWQLQEYQMRMACTAEDILRDLERHVLGLPVYRNDKMCTNWHHYNCAYIDDCRQGSPELQAATRKNGYIVTEIWNTEAVKPIT
jgi:PD-(D/E)XK nuclease superfamily